MWNSFYWYVGDGFRCSSALCLFSSCSYTICSTQIDFCPSQVAMYVYIAVFCICLQSCHKALWIYRFITLSVESVKFVLYQYLYVWFYREKMIKVYLAIVQLVERWTVEVFTKISIGHWFESGSRDYFCLKRNGKNWPDEQSKISVDLKTRNTALNAFSFLKIEKRPCLST